MREAERILGIDPGTRHLGWGIIEGLGTRIEHIAHGVIDVDTSGTFAYRLVQIDDALAQIIEQHRPSTAAVESLFFAKDAQSAAKLGHARGVVLLRMERSGVAIHEYAPALIKRSVAGRGAADKRQVALFVQGILRLKDAPRSDAADALAVALTHFQAARFRALVSK